jgi:hypothetical protein
MPELRYQATFHPGDDPVHIWASLSCPACLSSLTDWELTLVPWDEGLRCTCRSCDYAWALAVDSRQALRLAMDPSIREDGEAWRSYVGMPRGERT